METIEQFKIRVGNNIRNARKARGWGLNPLALRIKSTQWNIFKIEKAISAPNIVMLKKIADALEVDIKDLL